MHRIALLDRSAARPEELEDRAVVQVQQHPADVEHHRLDAHPGHQCAPASAVQTLPLSPARRLTATTVARGKKLKSVALAQV